MLNAQDKTKLTKLSHAALLLGLLLPLLLSSPAHAVDVGLAAKNAWVSSQLTAGVENQWTATKSASFRRAQPDPVAFGRWQFEVGFLPFKPAFHAKIGRRIDRDRPWVLESGLSIRIK